MRAFLTFLTVIAITASVGAQQSLPILTIPRLESPPALDGRLDDPQWSKAAVIPYFLLLPTNQSPTQPTEVRVFYTDKALYAGFDCRESQMDKIAAEMKDRDGNIWSDDCLELFIRPGAGLTPYYHLVANSLGTQYDSVYREVGVADPSYNSDWKVRTFIGKDRWQAEFEIPFSAVNAAGVRPGEVWFVNFCRGERPVSENSSWSTLLKRFHEPENFGKLVFGSPDTPIVKVAGFTGLPNGLVERVGEVHNPSAKPIEMSLKTSMPADGKERSFDRIATVPAGGMQSFRFQDQSGEGRITAVFEASVGGNTICRLVRPFYVPPVKTRLAQLTARLDQLEKGAAANVPLQALREKQKAIEKDALWIAESPERVPSVMRALDELERCVVSAEVRSKVKNGGDFFAWAANPWVQLKPSDLPPTDYALRITDYASAYRGEKVYAAVNVTNLTDRTLDLRVSAGPFASDKDSVPTSSTEVHTCAFVKEDGNSESLVGDALPLADQANRLIVPQYETGQAFLIIGTKGLKPGDYAGTVSIAPTTGGDSQSVTLNFKILPIDLPDDPKPRLCTWGGIINISWAKPDPSAYLKDAVDHGINVFAVNPQSAAPTLDKEGNITEPIDYTAHDKLAKAYAPYGLISGMYSIGIAYDSWAKKAGMEYMSPAYQKGFIAWTRDWIAHLKSLGLGYQDFVFELVDEPNGADEFKLFMDIGRLMRQADPKARTVLTVNFDDFDHIKQAAEVTDVWVPHNRVLANEAIARAMKDSGKEMWVYVCAGDSRRLDPINYYRSLPWQAFRYDLSGWGFFAHMWWGELPWESKSSAGKPLATFSSVYPGANGPVTSRRWEAYWKGHEDFRALHLLRSLISGAEKAGLAPEPVSKAKSVLEEAKNAPARLEEMQRNGVGTQAQAEFLDTLRSKIAESSIVLSPK